MAIGSIFAEFDLDYTKFDKNKQKLETSAKATVTAMEKQWDNLTEKQMAEYGEMVAYVRRKHAEILADTQETAVRQARAYTIASGRMKQINADMAYQSEKAAKQNQENADYWISKKRVETQAVKEFQNAMAAQKKEEMSLNDKANKQNAEWWMAKRKFDEDARKRESANYDALGIKSKAYYTQQKAEATKAYQNLAAMGENDFRVQKAYKDRLRDLDREYSGQHATSMAGMVRSALALYAAYYVVSQVVGTVANFLKSGLEAADQMKTSAIAVAASITTSQGNPENYRKNYEYASALVLKLREVDKVSFATYENILLMNRAMELQGVHLDMNSKAQMSVFTSLTNAVALYTSGQDQAKQAAQEFRSIFSGNIKAGSEVAKIIDEQAKASGKYANGLKDILKQSKDHKDVLEKIRPFLVGIEASVKDISKTWESATTSLQSSWNMMKASMAEALFPDAAQNIKDLAGAIEKATPDMANGLRFVADTISDIVMGYEKIYYLAKMAGAKVGGHTNGSAEQYQEALIAYNALEDARKKRYQDSIDFAQKMQGWTRVDTNPFELPANESAKLYDSMKKVNGEFGQTLYYVKKLQETPDTGPGADQIAENLRQRTRSLASQKEAAKDAYEMAIRNADQMRKLAIAQGKWELDANAESYRKKSGAIESYHKKLTGFAEQEISIEAAKAKAADQEFDATDARFNKRLSTESEITRATQGIKDDRDRQDEAARQRTVDETAKAYDLINKYSEKSINAQIADINRRYDASASAVNKEINDAARAAELAKVRPSATKGRTDERLSVLGVVAPDSDEAMDAFRENLQAQADLMNDQFNSQKEKENWLTVQITEEWRKRHEAAAGYYGGIEGFTDEAYKATLAAIEETRKADERKYGSESANRKAIQATQKANEARFDAEHADILKVTSATADMFGNAKALMNENSREYAMAHNAQMAMQAIEIAIQAEKNLMIAVGAVLNQATGEPYSAFARMAAMAAAVAGVLSIVGIGFTSFGGQDGEAKNPNAYADGTGTLLGSDEASQSIVNVAEILKDSHASEYARLTGIYQEVRSLNDNITGLVRGIALGGDFGATGAVTAQGSLLSSTSRAREFASDFGENAMKVVPVIGFAIKTIADIAGKAIEGVFGGKKETSQVGGGIAVSGETMGGVMSGASGAIGQFFRDMKEVTDGGWFHSDKTKFWSTFSALDADTNRLLTQVFSNLGSTALEIAEGFGVDVTSQLDSYAVNIGKIDLMGKSADEISEELTGIFSKYGDKLVKDLFGNIVSQYQKINEGMLETAIRLLNDQTQVEEIFRMTRITADASIGLSESLIKIAGGLDALKESATTYYDAFFSDAEKASDRQYQLTESLSQLGYILPGTRQGFRDLVESTKAMTGVNQEAYVSLLNMAGKADEYYSYVEEKQDEILSSFKSQLSAVQNALKSFTTQTSESVVASIDDIIRRTRAGIVVPDSELSAALNAATSTDTSNFSTGLAYDLNRARNAAALRELESATAGWVSTDEAQLAVLEQQAATLNTLTTLTAQTTAAIAGDDGTVMLLSEIKGLLTNSAVYVKRISDNVDEINETGVETRT